MSGKPYPEGVADFRAALKEMSEAAEVSARLQSEITNARLELDRANEAYQKAKETLFRLMKEMDVESSHNYGWEGRISWFFVELYKQEKAQKERG